MIDADAAIALFERALNRYIQLDPEAPRRLEPLQGRIVCFEVAGFEQRLFFIPGARGLQVFGRYEGEPDCIVRGPPLALARMGLERRKEDRLFSGDVQVLGDTHVANQFGAFIARLDVDWEEQLARLLGDPLAHELGRTASGARRWARRSGETLSADLGEYLVEEARLLPSRYEVEQFLAEVDRLRDDVERLAARIERMRRSQGSEPEQRQ